MAIASIQSWLTKIWVLAIGQVLGLALSLTRAPFNWMGSAIFLVCTVALYARARREVYRHGKPPWWSYGLSIGPLAYLAASRRKRDERRHNG